MPVSMPIFSAFSSASSDVPVRRASAATAAMAGSDSSDFASGWSALIDRKLAPIRVSGRVV